MLVGTIIDEFFWSMEKLQPNIATVINFLFTLIINF